MSQVTCKNPAPSNIDDDGNVPFGLCPDFPEWFANARLGGTYRLTMIRQEEVTAPNFFKILVNVRTNIRGTSLYGFDINYDHDASREEPVSVIVKGAFNRSAPSLTRNDDDS